MLCTHLRFVKCIFRANNGLKTIPRHKCLYFPNTGEIFEKYCYQGMNAYLMIFFFLLCLFFIFYLGRDAKVTMFLCSGWIIILITIFPIYLMLMISDDRHVMAVCWFKRIDMRVEWERSFDKDYYWFEVQILLTTVLTIFLPISLIIACNIRVLTIGK